MTEVEGGEERDGEEARDLNLRGMKTLSCVAFSKHEGRKVL